MGNCQEYETVDFGEGSVRVRCTQTGAHAQHRTEVFFKTRYSEVQPHFDISQDGVIKQNIFEKTED